MKLLIITLLFAWRSAAIAQTSFPVPTKDAKWEYINYDGQPGFPPWTTYMVSTADSTFLGTTYHTFNNNFLFRQDSNKVYKVDRDSQEVLLYDFGLQVGDTFTWRRHKGVVSNISTTSIDGKSAKVFRFNHVMYAEWVEGLGNVAGWFGMPFYDMVDGGSELCRFYLKNKQVYIQSGVCWPLGESIIEKLPDPVIQISPNPSSGILHIHFPNPITQFRILDFCGKEIKKYTDVCDEKTINCCELPAGLYLIQDSNHLTAKFLKSE